jgi:hypothetical protein
MRRWCLFAFTASAFLAPCAAPVRGPASSANPPATAVPVAASSPPLAPQVLNMTTWVEKGGHASCVSATWNAPQKLEELRFVTAYRRILTWLKGR